MNINNKIAVHRGVYFPRPEASAFSVNWKPGHVTYANEFAYLNILTGAAPVMEPLHLVNTTAVTSNVNRPAVFEAMRNGNFYVTYQGSEEPYNKPDITDLSITALDSLMVPENLYIRMRDLLVTVDFTKFLVDGPGTPTIDSTAVGKVLYATLSGTSVVALAVGAAAAADLTIGIITAVDTTSTPGATLVTLVC